MKLEHSRGLLVQSMRTTKNVILVRCNPYYTEVDSGQNIRAECFSKIFGPNVLPRGDFHMVRLTLVDDMLTLYNASTTTTVQTVKKAGAEYDGVRIVDGDQTRIEYLFTVSITIR